MLTRQNLFATGSVLTLSRGEWDRMANFRPADLGIEETEEVRAAFTWGHMRLIPESYIKPVRKQKAAAKNAQEARAVYFPLIHGARFLPATERDDLIAELVRIKKKREQAVEELIAGYEQAKREQYPVLVGALKKAALNPVAAQAAIDRIPGMYPTPEQVRAKFHMSWRLFSLASPIDGLTQDMQEEANSVREALTGMLARLREEIEKRSQEIVDLVVKGGKITEKTYKSTRRLCDKIDAVTRTLRDPALISASRALRQAVDAASDTEDDADRDRELRQGFKAVTRELSVSVEKSVELVEEELTAIGKRKLAL